jgi:hypothetical protein
MSNVQSPSVEEFQRSLQQLVQQAQATAQLGLAVAREQVEGFVKNPNVPVDLNTLNAQVEEVRNNLQTMARDMETKAQELVHLASTYVPVGGNPFAPAPRAQGPQTEVKVEPPTGAESHTAAGAGTAQAGSHGEHHAESTPTPNGEIPKQ